jgi:hypothetical protein
MLFCNVPLSYPASNEPNSTSLPFNLARVFEILNTRKEQKMIESYSVTQTTLEQIFVQLAGEDEDASSDRIQTTEQSIVKKTHSVFHFEIVDFLYFRSSTHDHSILNFT